MKRLKSSITEITPHVIKWRRSIHENPELGNEEVRTAGLVEKVLREAGIQVKRIGSSTAVVAEITGGRPGKTLAFRADMDALPIEEMTDLPFRSKVPNVMHACGHDFHVSILMGFALILNEMRDCVPGTVKMFFQPSEEKAPGGAIKMVEAGVMENPKVDMVFGMHVSPNIKVGMVEVPVGYASANSDFAGITIRGQSGHGANPEKATDALLAASHIVVALQSIVSRNIAALDSAVITIGTFHAGTVSNVIAETAELTATIRSLTSETRDLLEKRVRSIIKNTSESFGATAEIVYERGYPAMYCDEEASNIIMAASKKVTGESGVLLNKRPGMGGEDFSYFAQLAPGGFCYLGARIHEGYVYPSHSQKAMFSEDCIPVGLEILLRTVFEANSDN